MTFAVKRLVTCELRRPMTLPFARGLPTGGVVHYYWRVQSTCRIGKGEKELVQSALVSSADLDRTQTKMGP